MGFDNECIPNIQSLAGEYFCPVCRQLVYPNEALQTQCTHLYCKPCLTYIVSTTRACPYDGYLVTEADSKPLIESNKSVADAIGLIPVQCLYHRSGCTWQGSLTECILHCTTCPYGNSPVVCNRCGTQIVHRQVQEHAQNCPGTQPLQQQDGCQAQSASGSTLEQSQSAAPASIPAGEAAATQTVQDQSQATTHVPTQSTPMAQTAEQWYQQYQQYYQQYPQYQQYYQQYGQFQQHMQQYQPMQAYPQGTQQMVMAQTSAQPYPQQQPPSQTLVQAQTLPHSQLAHAQPQPPIQPQSLPQVPAQPQAQPQVQPQVSQQSHGPGLAALTQGQLPAQPQPQPQAPPQQQTQPPHQPQPQSQSQLQQQPQPQGQPHLLPQPQVVPQQQGQPHPHPLQPHPYTQPQAQTYQHPYPQAQSYAHAQQPLPAAPQSQQHFAHPQPQNQQAHIHPSQPQMQNLPAVTGHMSYPQKTFGMPGLAPQSQHQQPVMPVHQQQQNAPVQQHPVQSHPQQQPVPQQVQVPNQFPSPQLRPPHPPVQSHTPAQHQQHPSMLPPQSQHPRGPTQQQPQMGPRPQGQPMQGHPYPGMRPPPQQQIAPQQSMTQYPPQPQAQLHQTQPYPGQPPNSGHHHQQQQPPFYPQHGQQPLQAMPTARPQGPHTTAQLAPHHNIPPQPFPAGPPSFGSQHHATGPIQNHGVQHQQPPVRPVQQSVNQLSPIPSMPMTNLPTAPQQHSPSLLKHSSSQHISLTSSMASQPGANFNQALGGGTSTQASSGNKQVSLQDQITESLIPSLKSESLPKDVEADDANPKSADLEMVSNGVASFNAKEEKGSENREEMLTKAGLLGSEFPDPSKVQKGEVLHEHGLVYSAQTVPVKDNASENVLETPNDQINNTLVDARGDQEQEKFHQDKENPDQVAASQLKENDFPCEMNDTGALQVPQLGQVSDQMGNSVSASDRVAQQSKHMLGPPSSETSIGLETRGGERKAPPTGKGSERSALQTPKQHLVGGPMLPQHHQMMAPVKEQVSQLGPSERNIPGDSQPGFGPDATRPVGYSNHTQHSQMQANTFVHPTHPIPFPSERDPRSFPAYHGPPYGQEGVMQRPPLQSMPPHIPNLLRRDQDPPHIIPAQGQIPPNRGPQGPSIQFGPSMLPHGPLNAEHSNAHGAPQPSFGSGQFMDPSQKGFDLPHPSYGQGHANSHAFPPGDAFTRPPMGVPRPGPFDSPGTMFPHGPGAPFGRPPPMTVEQPDGLRNRRPFESWQPDTRPSLSSGHPPPEQSSGVFLGNRKGPEGLHESVLSHPLQDGRSRPLPGERLNSSKDDVFKPLPDEGFKPFPLDEAKRVVDKKEFEEDLKKFPRPRHLEGERGFQYDESSARPGGGYSSSNMDPFRNLEGASHAFDRDSVFKYDGTSLPPKPFGSIPSSGIRERFWPSSVHGDNFDKKFDHALPRPDFLGPGPQSGHTGVNNLPPPRSPGTGRFMGGSPHGGSVISHTGGFGGKEARFGDRSWPYSHSSDDKPSSFHNRTQVSAPEARFSSFQPSSLGPSAISEPSGPGGLPNHFRHGDTSGHIRNGDVFGLSSHARFGESAGPFKLPSYLPPHPNVGESLGRGALRMGEPDFPVEGNYFDPMQMLPVQLSHQREMEFFDRPRKRKMGNMAWCRICQIDCETVEGLDHHAQSREHQKKAMDMVISIKKDSAKKKKRSSEDNAPLDDVMLTKNKQ